MEKILVFLIVLFAFIFMVFRAKRVLSEGGCSDCSGECRKCACHDDEAMLPIEIKQNTRGGAEQNDREKFKKSQTRG